MDSSSSPKLVGRATQTWLGQDSFKFIAYTGGMGLGRSTQTIVGIGWLMAIMCTSPLAGRVWVDPPKPSRSRMDSVSSSVCPDMRRVWVDQPKHGWSRMVARSSSIRPRFEEGFGLTDPNPMEWWTQGHPEYVHIVGVGLGWSTQTTRIIRRSMRRLLRNHLHVIAKRKVKSEVDVVMSWSWPGSYTNLTAQLRLRELPLNSGVGEVQKGLTFGGGGCWPFILSASASRASSLDAFPACSSFGHFFKHSDIFFPLCANNR